MLNQFLAISPMLRLLVGIIFVFSGLIKLNDPIGFSITIQTYFQGFAIDFSSLFLVLIPYSLLIAISVCVLEVILGMALLLKFEVKLVIRVLFLLTGFFALLTLYTWWFRRMGSCGCLSSAIPLTPRQSFIKNIFLLLALHLLNKHSKHAVDRPHRKQAFIYLIFIAMLSIGMGWYTASRLPIIDFSPYRIGSNIVTSIEHHNTLQNRYWIEKESPFIENNVPTTYKPNIIHFIIWNEQKEITQEVLKGAQLIGIIHQPIHLLEQDATILQDFMEHIVNPLKIVWLLPLHEEKDSLPPFIVNHIAWGSMNLLQSMMRADIGFVLLQDGIVTGKWSYRDLSKLKKELVKRGFY